MPWHELIDDLEERRQAAPDHQIPLRLSFAELVTKAVAGAGGIGRLANAIEIAERPEIVRRIPRVERELIDEPFGSPPLSRIDILLWNCQRGDPYRCRVRFCPLD